MRRKTIRQSQLEKEIEEQAKAMERAHPDVPRCGRFWVLGVRWLLKKNARVVADGDKAATIRTPNRSFTERMAAEYGLSRSRIYVLLHGDMPVDKAKRAIAEEIRSRAEWEQEHHTISVKDGNGGFRNSAMDWRHGQWVKSRYTMP